MESINESKEIEIFSHLIETILYYRLSGRAGIREEIKAMIEKAKGVTDEEGMALNVGIKMISKIHERCEFHVGNVLRKHFQDHLSDKFSIYLEIFTLHKEKTKEEPSSHFYQSRNKLIEKWVFRKNLPETKRLPIQNKELKSDLFLYILTSLKEILETENPNNNNTTVMGNNNKSYEIVIRSKCAKKQKFVTHVFHHERNNHEPSLHTMYMKTSLLEMPKYWEKTLFFNQKSNVTFGCYLAKETSQETMILKTEKEMPQSVDAAFLRQPDRKLSSETKAEEKDKSSTSSFRFSLGLGDFPFSLNLNHGLKYSSAEIGSRKKSSEEILQHHRPRYQSIYESKDEEMNIFILSPRKLSDEESPKAKYLEQKTIKFDIADHFAHGISEEVIEEFVLEPDEIGSNVSSEGFEMLWDEGEGETDKVMEEESENYISEEKMKENREQELFKRILEIEAILIESLKGLDKKLLFI